MKCDKCGVDPDELVKMINECRDKLARYDLAKFINDFGDRNPKLTRRRR